MRVFFCFFDSIPFLSATYFYFYYVEVVHATYPSTCNEICFSLFPPLFSSRYLVPPSSPGTGR